MFGETWNICWTLNHWLYEHLTFQNCWNIPKISTFLLKIDVFILLCVFSFFTCSAHPIWGYSWHISCLSLGFNMVIGKIHYKTDSNEPISQCFPPVFEHFPLLFPHLVIRNTCHWYPPTGALLFPMVRLAFFSNPTDEWKPLVNFFSVPLPYKQPP